MVMLSDTAAKALGVTPGVAHDEDFLDYRAEEITKNIAWLLRDAAKKRRIKRLRDGLQYTLFFGVVAIVVCAANGIWWPFEYTIAPIVLPLWWLLMAFYGMPTLDISPMAVVIFLLFMIWIKLDTRK